MAGTRELVVLRGPAEATRSEAQRWLEGSRDTLWVGAPGEARVAARAVRSLLGQARDAVVLELYEGLNLEVLAQVEGLVRGGGRLILLEPEQPVGDPSLAIEPHAPDDVGLRSWAWLRASLPPNPLRTPLTIAPGDAGTDEQARLVERLAVRWRGAASHTAVMADRGRGKSSALGLAIAALGEAVTVSGPHPDAVREVLRFGGALARYVPLGALLEGSGARHVVIDEAAQIDVPTLRRIAAAHRGAHLTWASTARGYEGTGAGWVQRFLRWVSEQGPFEQLHLQQPIRWAPGDALEAWVRRALLFDATPARLASEAGPIVVRALAPDELADPALLEPIYGLLMHAHHRTTPSDLSRMLDAPNLAVHVAFEEGRVVGVNLVAHEGGLTAARSHALARERVRGHVLADTLVSHGGHLDAGTLRMIRSVRIATHPERRRRGIARQLTEHVHGHYQPDLFGTVFGASAELVAFRQALGYQVARLGSSAGARSGEPSVVMLRPVSERALGLTHVLRDDLARQLPLQLRLLSADGVPVAEDLERRLAHALGSAGALSPEDERARLEHYLTSGQTFEAAVGVLHGLAVRHAARLASLDRIDAALIGARVIEQTSWSEAASRAGMSVPRAQRRLRAALRALLTFP